MKTAPILALIILSVFFSAQALATDNAIEDVLDAKVSEVVESLRDEFAMEHEEARGLFIHELNDNNTIMAMAIFTIEGFSRGNNYSQFLAVFLYPAKKSILHKEDIKLLDVKSIGGKGEREIDNEEVRIAQEGNHVGILLNTKEYGPNDPMCCPSVKGNVIYSIVPAVGGKLKEEKEGT